nr:tubulin alpha-2 chain {internal fragment} [Drosophila melanogaster, CME W2 wing imaginal disc cell line, Peptide Partial, 15 aa] [Drosophila melanogaster]
AVFVDLEPTVVDEVR